MFLRLFPITTCQCTVEPRLTATSVIRSPRYYGRFFGCPQNDHTFCYKKNLVNTTNGQIFEFQTKESFTISPCKYGHSTEIQKIKMPVTCQSYLF